MNRVQKAVVGSVLGVAVLGSVVGGAAAADPTPAVTPGPAAVRQGPGGGHGPGFDLATGRGVGAQAISGPIAELLGLTPEDIEAKRESGQSLAQIASDKGVSEAKLVEALVATRKSALDARVKAGTLTQAQADAALAQMQSRAQESIQRTETGPNRRADGQGLGLAWGRETQRAGSQAQPGAGWNRGGGARWAAGQ